jgi:hypothetical protein
LVRGACYGDGVWDTIVDVDRVDFEVDFVLVREMKR